MKKNTAFLFPSKIFILAILSTLIFTTNLAAQSPAFEIWEGEIPFSDNYSEDVKPTLKPFLTQNGKNPTPAVIVCPGGGYRLLAMKVEGYEVAKALQERGISAFVLKYRIGSRGNRHPAMLSDIQQAIAIVRKKAKEWNIDPNKIGAAGFSAGGHLCSTAGTFTTSFSNIVDTQGKKISSRPNFLILGYPVITMTEELTHKGSRRYLLGKNFTPEQIRALSTENLVTSSTPPTFITHAKDDTCVPFENSVLFYDKLQKAGVPSQFFIYETGNHGYSVHKREWFESCLQWLKTIGIYS